MSEVAHKNVTAGWLLEAVRSNLEEIERSRAFTWAKRASVIPVYVKYTSEHRNVYGYYLLHRIDNLPEEPYCRAIYTREVPGAPELHLTIDQTLSWTFRIWGVSSPPLDTQGIQVSQCISEHIEILKKRRYYALSRAWGSIAVSVSKLEATEYLLIDRDFHV